MKRALTCLLLTCTASFAVPPEIVPGDDTPWPRHCIDFTSRGADGVKTGHLNGDGLIDLVTGWEEGGVVRAYLHPGQDKVTTPWPHVTVGQVTDAEEAIFADLDRDGLLDVLSGTEGKSRTLFWHRQKGSPVLGAEQWQTLVFPATHGTQMWMQAAALQMDERNGPDLLLGSKGSNAAIGWLEAPAEPLDLPGWRYHRLRDAGWIMSILLHDVDGDSDLDCVFTDRKGDHSGLGWLENPGAARVAAGAAWKEHRIGLAKREVMFADVGDLNADGLIDVAAAVKPHDLALFLRQKDGSWQETMLTLQPAKLGDAKAVKIGDLNADGLPDLVFTCENAHKEREGVVWLEQRKDAPWRQHALSGPAGVKFDLAQLLDLDGDNDLDVVTCEEREQLGLIWYQNPMKQ